MTLRAVQDQNESVRQMFQHICREGFDLRGTDMVVVQGEVQAQPATLG